MPKYKAAAYIRLSYTDDRHNESDSVNRFLFAALFRLLHSIGASTDHIRSSGICRWGAARRYCSHNSKKLRKVEDPYLKNTGNVTCSCQAHTRKLY